MSEPLTDLIDEFERAVERDVSGYERGHRSNDTPDAKAALVSAVVALEAELAEALKEKNDARCRSGQNALRYERAETERDEALRDCRTLAKLADSVAGYITARYATTDEFSDALNRRDFYLRESARPLSGERDPHG